MIDEEIKANLDFLEASKKYTGNAAKRKLMQFVSIEHLQRMGEVFFDGKIPPSAVEVWEE